MKRKLIQQMRNEWRSNLWMGIELFIVGLVLWAIFSTFGFFANLHQPPRDYDLTDIYHGDLWIVGKNKTTYKAYPDSAHNEWTDLSTLLSNLRNNPYVEMLGTGNNALPYSYNYSGNQLTADLDDRRESYNGNLRNMSPDFVRTIRLRGLNGETTEELATMIENGNIIISLYDGSRIESTPEQWRGRDVFWSYDSTRVEHVGAVIAGIRRNDYEPIFGGNILKDNMWFPSEIAIRVKPGKGREFMESLKSTNLEFGNVYISNMQSIDRRRESAHLNINTIIRNLTTCAVFVLTAVFLGFLGSFWYKTQQRAPELALRRVNGATRADLFRRLLGEGMLILLVSAVPTAAVGGFLLTNIDFEGELGMPFPLVIPWLMFGAAMAALALMIAAGICFPASKAMKIDPAQALKDQ